MANKSLPPIGLYVRNEFLFNQTKGHGEYTYGHLIGVRALQNQAMQFLCLLENGALFTGLPAHAFCFEKDSPARSLLDCQMWDNISSEIDVVRFDTLLYMPCTVKLEDSKEIVKGQYLFSVDYVGNLDFSRCPIHWKTLHAIKLDDGNLVYYPQYRIQFRDTAICAESDKGLPAYNFNETIWSVGS
jgi:hypothetical protein